MLYTLFPQHEPPVLQVFILYTLDGSSNKPYKLKSVVAQGLVLAPLFIIFTQQTFQKLPQLNICMLMMRL